jgi:hypothetical protein
MARSGTDTEEKLQQRPPQHQAVKPGHQKEMTPRPLVDDPEYRPAGKLIDKVALITRGDSGIGQAVAVAYAKEGADIAVIYFNIWTPLIPASFSPEDVQSFGKDTPMERAGQPAELAPSYVFLATKDSS